MKKSNKDVKYSQIYLIENKTWDAADMIIVASTVNMLEEPPQNYTL